LRAAYGADAAIYFVIGSDSLAELPQWFQIKELLSLIQFAIAERREVPLKESLWQEIREKLGEDAEEQLRSGVVSVQRVDVSSTLIRKLLSDGDKVTGYLRHDVEEYIRRKGLYGAPPKATMAPRIIR
jgi:nicotinate-nucleotide adenylyltransferase